jgi:hypothetical protein
VHERRLARAVGSGLIVRMGVHPCRTEDHPDDGGQATHQQANGRPKRDLWRIPHHEFEYGADEDSQDAGAADYRNPDGGVLQSFDPSILHAVAPPVGTMVIVPRVASTWAIRGGAPAQ